MTTISINKVKGGFTWTAPNPVAKGKIRGIAPTLDAIHHSCCKWFGDSFIFNFLHNVESIHPESKK